MAISDDDLQELLRIADEGRQQWISGSLGYVDGGEVAQDEDMTIFGPFGGGPLRGTAQLADRQPKAAALFAGGTGSCELVKAIVEGDLAVLVLHERNDIRRAGEEGTQPWNLRTTSVFRRTPSGWVRLHRHADPLHSLASPDETFALARARA